jgi:hypothetical protein
LLELVEKEIAHRHGEKIRRGKEREERERAAAARAAAKERERIAAGPGAAGGPTPGQSRAGNNRGPTPKEKALTNYFERTNLTPAPRVFTEKMQLSWRANGARHLAFFTPKGGRLDVWIQVQPGTLDASIFDGQSFLPANTDYEIRKAWPNVAR